VPELERLRADHASAVLDFEVANRAFFALSISDRGEEFFEQFAERFDTLLADQRAGLGAFHVLVADDGAVLGRFNLTFVDDHSAQLGYRVAQAAVGQGLATATVRELCRLAPVQYGLRTVRAAASAANVASQRVLTKAGFLPVGPADPAELGGKPGTWFERRLTARPDDVIRGRPAIEIGTRRRSQPPPPHIVFEALVQPDRDPARPWLMLLDGERAPSVLRREDPYLVEWSSVWVDRPDARIRFDLSADAGGTSLRWTLSVEEPPPDAPAVARMRSRINQLVNANLRSTFGR
jgi:ribosomal-protein-alanine N-acetyltransferase